MGVLTGFPAGSMLYPKPERSGTFGSTSASAPSSARKAPDMTSQAPRPALASATARRRSAVIAVLAIVDFVVLLFPPIHWALRPGDAAGSIAYFIGSGVFVTITIVLFAVLDPEKGE